MENKGTSKEQGKKKMGFPIPKQGEEYLAQGIIEYLEDALGVTRTMLAGLIEVTERTLSTWQSNSTGELEGKAKRLLDLYEFVQQAQKMNVRKSLLLNLLHEPIDSKNEDSSSILYYIVHEPASRLLKETAPLIIKRFLEN